MKVSVIIPVYNAAPYLRECVDSVRRQTHSELEIVLIDDGSSDGSGGICDAIASEDARVQVLHTSNSGQAAARNRGLECATGDYIMFVDADDAVHSRIVEYLLGNLKINDAQIAMCRMFVGQFPKYREPVDVSVYQSHEAITKILYQDPDVLTGVCAQLFSSNLFSDELRFPEGKIYEDLYLQPLLYERASRVAVSDGVLYFYRNNPFSTINTWGIKRLDVLELTERLERHFGDTPEVERAVRDRRLSAAFNILMLNARNGRNEEISRICMSIITRLRFGSLMNGNVRIKNKIGILASLFGRHFLELCARVL